MAQRGQLMDWTAVTVTFLVGAFGLGAPYLAYRQKRIEQTSKDTTKEVEETAHEVDSRFGGYSRLIDQLQEEVKRLSIDLETTRAEVRGVYSQLGAIRARLVDVETGARILIRQIEEEGPNPPRWHFPIRAHHQPSGDDHD